MTQIGDDNIDWDLNWQTVQTNEKDADVKSLDWFFTYLPDGKFSVLEIGCGIGRFANAFKLIGGDYYGIDFSEVAIHKARILHPEAHFFRGFNTEVRIFGITFNVVFTNTHLQHVNNYNKNFLFSEIHKVVSPQGLFILSAEKHDYDAKTTITKDKLITTIESHGFKLEHYEPTPLNGFVFRKT